MDGIEGRRKITLLINTEFMSDNGGGMKRICAGHNESEDLSFLASVDGTSDKSLSIFNVFTSAFVSTVYRLSHGCHTSS